MSTFNVSLELPTRHMFRNVDGAPVYLDLDAIPAATLADILVGGIQIISGNTFNSGGKEVPESERIANVQKRWDSWKRGEYRITERNASASALMKECYIEEMLAKHPAATAKVIEAKMKATVKDILGETTNATFDNFLAATATAMSMRDGETRNAAELKALLVAKYEKAAAELEASRNKAAKVDIDLTDFDI